MTQRFPFTSCLVTGGCGFIGINLVQRLRQKLNHIRVFDNLSTGKYEHIRDCGVEFVQADIRDSAALGRACKGMEAVVHLAAHTGVVASVQEPLMDFEVNALGTLQLLRCCRQEGVRKCVVASTGGAVIGMQTPPVHEEMVPKPVSPYGAGKLAAEGYCHAFWGAYNFPTVVLRFSNVYGPYSFGKASVVASFMKNIYAEKPLTVFGDGNQTRDFLYVQDLVSAVISALLFEGGCEVFQIASGRETSIRELIDLLKHITAPRDVEVRYEPFRKGEILKSYSSIAKAGRLLGFYPATNLENGLSKTWEWFTKSLQ